VSEPSRESYIKAVEITQSDILSEIVRPGAWIGGLNLAIARALDAERESAIADAVAIIERAADDEHGAVADDLYLLADEVRTAGRRSA